MGLPDIRGPLAFRHRYRGEFIGIYNNMLDVLSTPGIGDVDEAVVRAARVKARPFAN